MSRHLPPTPGYPHRLFPTTGAAERGAVPLGIWGGSVRIPPAFAGLALRKPGMRVDTYRHLRASPHSRNSSRISVSTVSRGRKLLSEAKMRKDELCRVMESPRVKPCGIWAPELTPAW
ncbi:uncharacterized protein LJ206_016509 [Theristicus caerulescens]